MRLSGKSVVELSNEDILSLIERRVPESITLDYKRDFKLKDDGDRSELLADITAFHNTEGGIIIFGLEDEKDELNQSTGIPQLPSGNRVAIDNYDKVISQIEEIVKNNTDPQLSHLSFSSLIPVNGCNVFAISIPKNLSLPTRISFKNSSKFYRRRNTGKYLLDTHELYNLFIKNMEMRDRAKQFIQDRIKSIQTNPFWDAIVDIPNMILHIIPLSKMGYTSLDFLPSSFHENMIRKLPPIMSSGYSYNHTFEGFVIHTNPYSDMYSYNSIFRDGCIEVFTTGIYMQDASNKYFLSGENLAAEVLQQVKQTIEFYITASIESPYCISLAFNNIKGMPISGLWNHKKGFKKESLLFPIVVIQDFKQDYYKAMESLFHIIWQSAGYEMCPPDILQKI
ncbi:AlbA family DNA-binding domain-containing protein [Chitinophaga rhizosphaerae]|uniref:AlbA family DNA-binding domain-containing protein n=1 Tax=Chitinophaga rhizosphaerae TaxID=1864947 RepID=UPI000F7FDDCD|nr:ATP-binding protein [Chitinophaga rhizosphaerae]